MNEIFIPTGAFIMPEDVAAESAEAATQDGKTASLFHGTVPRDDYYPAHLHGQMVHAVIIEDEVEDLVGFARDYLASESSEEHGLEYEWFGAQDDAELRSMIELSAENDGKNLIQRPFNLQNPAELIRVLNIMLQG